MTRKLPNPDPSLTVEVPGGRGRITMRPFTTREYIAMRRSDFNDVELMEMTIAAVVEYLPGKDPLDLPPLVCLGLATAWLDAGMEEAVSPPTA